MIQYLVLAKPFLSFIGLLLAESEVDEFFILILYRRERNHMFGHVAKVVSSIFVSAGTQTLETFCQSNVKMERTRDGHAL
jgi:hypothetical protein